MLFLGVIEQTNRIEKEREREGERERKRERERGTSRKVPSTYQYE